MSDSIKAKAQKLAAARKRLKEYQQTQLNKQTVKKDDDELAEGTTPVDSMTSSTHSAFESCATIQEERVENNKTPNDNNIEINQTFIDNNIDANPTFNVDNNIKFNNYFSNTFSGEENSLSNLSNYFVELKQDGNVSNNKLDAFTFHVNKNETGSHQNAEYADPFDAIDNSRIKADGIEDSDEANLPLSNTESLRQLSSQITTLLDADDPPPSINTIELEQRNQQLAALLAANQLKLAQSSQQLHTYTHHIAQLEAECERMRTEHETKLHNELTPLHEQLQYHAQTVGILVGEKTELTHALTECQNAAKEKMTECEELHSRLKASRFRVAELEKEMGGWRAGADGQEKAAGELDKLRTEEKALRERVGECEEEVGELREKLDWKVEECLKCRKEIEEKNLQLSLAQLKLQQLTTSETLQTESQLELLNQQKIALEHQLSELTESVKTANADRDQANQQYQQYVQQLNGQMRNIAEKLETKCRENETLTEREQSLVKHIGDLEKRLQQLQVEQQQLLVTTQHCQDANGDASELKQLNETVQNLRDERHELHLRCDEETKKRQASETQVEELSNRVAELEEKVEQLNDQPDATKLMATIESDKVAASRAVEQNKKLKEQLEELHEAFIKMSNNKLELTEQLQSEEYKCHDLSEKLDQSTSMVEHLHEVIAIKDNEFLKVQNASVELEKQVLHQNQLTDRLRHYEAQGNTSEHVQHELQSAKRIIAKLTEENETLRMKLKSNELLRLDTKENELVQLNAKENETLLLGTKEDEPPQLDTNAADNETTNEETMLSKELAMLQLEERFKKTMIEVANLTDEKHRLEHLVMQLQSETETIGEYVTLYQCQRALLKEKTIEKDEQLKHLAHEREEMKLKLDKLNALVEKLVQQKSVSPTNYLENSVPVQADKHDNNNKDSETAERIKALLSEIKTSNLVQTGDGIYNFHPCPLCSGQLITV